MRLLDETASGFELPHIISVDGKVAAKEQSFSHQGSNEDAAVPAPCRARASSSITKKPQMTALGFTCHIEEESASDGFGL